MAQRSFLVREEMECRENVRRVQRATVAISTVQVLKVTASSEVPPDAIRIDMRSLGGESVTQRLCGELGASTSHVPYSPANNTAFLSRALAWVKLSACLIAKAARPNLPIVFEHIDAASEEAQRDVARIIEFHHEQRISRTFLLVVDESSTPLSAALLAATSHTHALAQCA
ncbi:MAG: hypothetical protein ACRC46_13770 [Thermoguttaceae bacterium]